MDSHEGKNRFQNFKANLEKIRKTNSLNLEYQEGINQFSDLSAEEFNEKMLTLRTPEGADLLAFQNQIEGSEFFVPFTEKVTLNRSPVDFRKAFGAARNQGQCGSCWAFSTMGAVEGAWGVKQGQPVQYLAPQQLVDCDNDNNGCQGGWLYNSFGYIKQYGTMAESSYPYRGVQQSCRYSSGSAFKVSSYKYCSNQFQQKCSVDTVYSLLTQGPLTVTIDGSAIQSYRGGVFTGYCSQPNHAVILAGYGADASGEYWTIRNSWGTTWGESGYIRVRVNEQNQHSCFITNEAWLPVL